jgi:hypothetical protein
MRWTGHVAQMGTTFLSDSLKVRNRLGNLGTDGTNLREMAPEGVMDWIQLSPVNVLRGGFWEHYIEPVDSIKAENFLTN